MSEAELCGLACVLCHRRLAPTWRATRLLDRVLDADGHTYGRYACAPACPGTPPPARPSPRPFLSASLPRWTPPPWDLALPEEWDNRKETIKRVRDRLYNLPDTGPPP